MNLVPGAGEIFAQPFVTAAGVVSALLVEAVPGGPLEPATRLDPGRDLGGTAATLVGLFERYAPALAARVDARRFSLLGPRDWLAGSITPTVRRAWAHLRDGRLALALGDAWIVNDPIVGQGANIGSHCAWLVAQTLAAAPDPDEGLGRHLEQEMWRFAGPVTALTNAFLQPPAPHVADLLSAASAHQGVADAFRRRIRRPGEARPHAGHTASHRCPRRGGLPPGGRLTGASEQRRRRRRRKEPHAELHQDLPHLVLRPRRRADRRVVAQGVRPEGPRRVPRRRVARHPAHPPAHGHGHRVPAARRQRGEAFDPTRTGFDHMGFKVDHRFELDEWQKHFESHGITFTPVVHREYGSVLTFKDPDGIQFEMFYREGHP
jgi:hypothetical protein